MSIPQLSSAPSVPPFPPRMAHASVREMAREILSNRLNKVAHLLKDGAERPFDGVLIHDLRVSCRKALAAVNVFRPVLRSRRTCRTEAQLKRILETTTVLRECDVFIGQTVATVDRTVLARTQFTSRRSRSKAERAFLRTAQSLLSGRFKYSSQKLTRRLGWFAPATPSGYCAWARERLAFQAAPFFASALPVVVDSRSLHRLRLRTKALRYTVECLAPALPAGFDVHVLPVLESLQSRLGNLNDEKQSVERIQGELHCLTASERPSLRAVLMKRRSHLHCSLEAFLQWWSPDLIDDLLQRTRAAVSAKGSTPGVS